MQPAESTEIRTVNRHIPSAQDGQRIGRRLPLLGGETGYLTPLARCHEDLVDADRDAVHRVRPHQIGLGGFGGVQAEIPSRAGQSEHGQGSLAGTEGALHQAGESRQWGARA